MARTKFDETDRLIFERWEDVAALIDAVDELKKKIRDFVGETEDRFQDWAKRLGFDARADGSEGEISLFRPSWTKRDEPKLMLVFGGLTAKCIFEIDGTKPYASVYIPRLRSLGLDRAGWERLRDQLKGRLGADFDGWDQDTDEEWLLNRYLEIDGNTMRRALLSRDALVDFVTGQFQRLIPLADTVDESLKSV